MDKEAKEVTKSRFYKIGMAFLIISLLTWIIPVIAPFMPFSAAGKAGVITGAIVFAEVMFWVGALLVGKEVAAKYKSYLNPKNWRKEKG
ncbi:transporter suffix domain-containing protein [Peribacillus muralis]|uniref:transporter suffix domain-containing protein n=1 Tax=Peribacillus muralis TaxID=264697 RepID=UPI000A8BE0F4|nr:transporter suffix domain-containing protein [Peribacillus muralis]